MREWNRPLLLAGLLLGGVSLAAGPLAAADLGTKVVRGALIGVAVKTAADPLNKFINAITLRGKVQTRMATKVVPILSVGDKGYVGGAQVSGPASLVKQVQAVFQYEQSLSNRNYRAKVLLPSASINPLELRRVAKVGVTAIIDVSLDGRMGGVTVGKGIQTGDVIRGAAVLAAVKVVGPEINKVVNAISFNKGEATCFVPYASIGEKAYLGGAQVSGSALTISKVKAVWQYEDLFDGGKFRVRAVVPVSALNPLEAKRVDGTGITAVVDMALAQQETLEARNERERRERWEGLRDRREEERRRERERLERERERRDNGKHKGWTKGKRKGHYKDKDRDD